MHDVPQYAKVELLVGLTTTATKFYDPDPAQGGIDLAATFVGPSGPVTVPGYYDGSSFRVRFAPMDAGAWTYSVSATDSAGTATWTSGSFTCVASGLPGFARIDGRNLRLSNGSVLFAVGHNNGWQYDLEQPSLASMAARRENLLSFWHASAWIAPSGGFSIQRAPIENVESGIGNYYQPACAYLDGLINRADAAGVYLQPALWSHGELRGAGHPWGTGWWSNSAYSTICTAVDFFKTNNAGVDTPQWRYQKNFFRYLLARWGYSRAIVNWVVVVEIEGTTGYNQNPTQAVSWCQAVRNVFAAQDSYRRNASGQVPLAAFKMDDASFDPGFGLRSVDTYAKQSDNVGVALQIASQTTTMRTSGKPCFHGEFGGNIATGATQPTHAHNGLWGGTSAGAAMTPLLWCDGGNFPMLTDPTVGDALRAQLEYVSEFTGGISYLGDPTLTAATITAGSANCRGWGMRLSDRGYAWLQSTSGSISGKTLNISGLANGLYQIEWFDVWSSGQNVYAVTPAALAADGYLWLQAPATTRADLACRFVKTADCSYALRINFQPSTAAVPPGYKVDSGSKYGTRGGGLTYGWSTANKYPYDRNSSLSADQRYDTTIFTKTYQWNLALASGTYQVRAVSGDASNYNSVYKVNVEGVLIVNGTPTSGNRWIEGNGTVTVADGKLTVTNGTGASNNKLCFLEVYAPVAQAKTVSTTETVSSADTTTTTTCPATDSTAKGQKPPKDPDDF